MPDYLNKEILILGCGNILFGDDGFGYAVINKLNSLKGKIPILNSDKIAIIDAGTGASHYILSLIDEETPIKKIIIVDAIDFGLKPGELIKLYPNELPKVRKYYLDAHNMPLAGMIREIVEKYGIEVVVIGCQVKSITAPDICLELSEEVKNAVDEAVNLVLEELSKI